jgi:CTD small phosphatase-like protein 2
MPQNFRLQKENGIYIRTFYGEDPDDTALTDLIPILINIAKEKKDVRKSLLKYRDEILRKISSHLGRQESNNKLNE